MARTLFGMVEQAAETADELEAIRVIVRRLRFPSAPVRFTEVTPFGYLFPLLQEGDEALLPPGPQTVKDLIDLGEAMREPGNVAAFDSAIPSAYTYFGQFLDHDLVLELQSSRLVDLDDPNLEPLAPGVISEQIKNRRSPTLDLDSVYGTTSDGDPVPRNGDELIIGAVSPSGRRPKNKDANNDLPRKPPNIKDPWVDREAIIGDARNDENFIISQLHLTFLRAHRLLVLGRGLTFREARRVLTQHYQWLVVNDFLKRVADKKAVNEVLTHGNRFFRTSPCGLFMPFEFSAAAFRFGHSMVRSAYDYNDNFQGATAAKLNQLFPDVAFSGPLAEFRTLPEMWIIQWEKFLTGGTNDARRIDTRVVEPLFDLPTMPGRPLTRIQSSLAVRNLLRGYVLRVPVGQKVSEALGVAPLSPAEILRAAAEVSTAQAEVLKKSVFLKKTPLWYYILAESMIRGAGVLGPVGSIIVAEVLIGLVRNTEDSIFSHPGWRPTLGTKPGVFNLQDLFRLGGVWG